MAAATTDKFTKVGSPGSATTLASPGYTVGNTSITVGSTSNWPTDTLVFFAMDRVEIVNGVEQRIAGTYNEFSGIVTGASTIGSLTKTYGTAQNYSAGSLTRVYIPVSSSRENALVDGLNVAHNLDGSLKTSAVQQALSLGTDSLNGWNALGYAPNTVTCNGQRSYDLTFNSLDLSTVLSNAMRLRTSRTVAAPNQCTSLNGSTQYWSKSSPSGLTFTDDFAVCAWVKLTSYPSSDAGIVSRFEGSNGWILAVNPNGQIYLSGYNAGVANNSRITSYQALPLNQWVRVAAQLDMSAFTATSTTSYLMADGVDIPGGVTRGGTNPTALVQGGSLNIGAFNGGNFFPGKIAQVAIFNAKVTQSTMSGYLSQGFIGTETSLASAYSFNNSSNDLVAAAANNLTANGSAVATNADSPFGGQANGSISTTLDYAIITNVVYSTNTVVTVQVAEGCTIPTSGGVAAVAYSSNSAPYGMPRQKAKWTVGCYVHTSETVSISSINNWFTSINRLTVPVGEWELSLQGQVSQESSVASTRSGWVTVATSTPTAIVSSVPSRGLPFYVRLYSGSSTTAKLSDGGRVSAPLSLASATTYRLYGACDVASGTEIWQIRGDNVPCKFEAVLSYL